MKVTCKKCFHVMRSDNLRRHMKKHVESKPEQVSFSLSETLLNTEFS